MKLIDTTCPYCGAKMKVDADKNHIVCEYCGSTLIVEKEAVPNAEEQGYQFEKGRQKAQKELHQQKQEEVKRAERKKKTVWLWVLGWIFVFPVPLTIILARKKEMKPWLRYGLIGLVWSVYLVFALIGMFSDEKEEKTTEQATSHVTESEVQVEDGDRYDESLNGRGQADKNREEPQYVGIIGYAVVSDKQTDQMLKETEMTEEELWTVLTYVKDKQFWNQEGSIPHRTEVVVREQILERENAYGKYKGYLFVERKDTGDTCYIEVDNFVTKKYWEYTSAYEAAKVGDFVAEFRQTSDYYPVDADGKKAEISDGTKLLVVGTPMPTSTINDKETDVRAYVWVDGKSVRVHVNSADLVY